MWLTLRILRRTSLVRLKMTRWARSRGGGTSAKIAKEEMDLTQRKRRGDAEGVEKRETSARKRED
jgi:hypothetical protein